MFELLFAFLLLQAAGTHTVNNKSTYLVTITSQTMSGSTETLCAHLLPKEPATFIVTLEVKNMANTILVNEVVTEDFYRCVSFLVPAVSTATMATIHVNVQGASETLQKMTNILINPSTSFAIIHTDKPIYKPGQTVMFRIVTLDTNFLPLNRKYQTVELQDPNRNRIAQWLNRSPVSGILDFSYPMALEAVHGIYVITAWDERGKETSHTFQVKEYVLPKYEVKVQLPDIISVLDKQMTVKVCGKYTYGKPVLGLVKMTQCYADYGHHNINPLCLAEPTTANTDKTGCATVTANLAALFWHMPKRNMYIHVEIEMEEYETGITVKGHGHTTATSNDPAFLSFEDTVPTFKTGTTFEAQVKVSGLNSSPLPSETVFILLNHEGKSENWTVTTDSEGVARLLLDTSSWTKDYVYLQAHLKEHRKLDVGFQRYRQTVISVTQFYSKSKSFVNIIQIHRALSCVEEGLLKTEYIIQGTELHNDQEFLTFFYLVLSRGSAVQQGHLLTAVKKSKVNKGEFTVHIRQTRDLAPYAQVIVYTVLPSGEIVADSSTVPIQKCLRNKVSLKFSSSQELPGEKTSLEVKADPGSLCSLRAIDKSVLLMEPHQDLTMDSIYSQLPVQRLSRYPSSLGDYEHQPCLPRPWEQHGVAVSVDRRKKRFYYFGEKYEKIDIYTVFMDVGVKILTNSAVRKPVDCGISYSFAASLDDMVHHPQKLPQETTIRTFFPETWIWDLVSVGDSGSVKVEHTVPDTITKWVAGAFCIAPTGFGLANSVGLTAFQPFFVSLTLPYSVIRGEMFALKATVFNYLSKCIMVQVSLNESAQYTAQTCEGCKYTHCLCGEESKTFKWILKPTDLGEVSVKVKAEALRTEELCGNEVVTVPERGRSDTVVRTLLVEAKGTKETITHNALVCPAESPVEKKVALKLPEVFVQGSVKAFLSVMGDLMGRAMKNLGSLLAMPYGCGEQNMVLFAPNIYILRYLETTRQLTEEIKAKATHFLENGYQRELNYKHYDGSYSAFGKADGSGNTWLTAFVLKSFGEAKPYIFVDPRHITDAIDWLSRHQQPSGCFMAVGKLFNNKMKGGVSDEVSLTAYITAGLLELNRNATTSMVARSLSCLKNASGQLKNLYTTALLSYTFTLAGDQEMRSKLITHMASKAKISGGSWQWQHLDISSKKTDSLEVEMASYMLLALLSGPQLPGFGLGYASVLVHWLVQQQNPYGGFSSTQDTVVALQALSLYSAATFSPEGDTTVAVTSGGGYKREFKLNQHNRMLYQEERLTQVPGNYNIKAEGKGCALVQIALHYNIPPPADVSAFSITANAEGSCNSTRKALTVTVNVRYNGRREKTNMVIISIKLLSGYLPDKASLQTLKNQHAVKRVEEDEGHIIIYVDELKKMIPSIYSLSIKEDVPVRNRKPAVVKVYDYYQTNDEAVSEYSSPCAEGDESFDL